MQNTGRLSAAGTRAFNLRNTWHATHSAELAAELKQDVEMFPNIQKCEEVTELRSEQDCEEVWVRGPPARSV